MESENLDRIQPIGDGLTAVEAEAVKRKRGRPPKAHAKPVQAKPVQVKRGCSSGKKVKEVEEDEDVCFICFDGGSLVLCDHRGCPKAYHAACIKRDEEFFESAAKWNCVL